MELNIRNKVYVYLFVFIIFVSLVFFIYYLFTNYFDNVDKAQDSVNNNLIKRDSFIVYTEHIADSVTPNIAYRYMFMDVYIDDFQILERDSRYVAFKGKIFVNDISRDVVIHLVLNNSKVSLFEQIPFDGRLRLIDIKDIENYKSNDGFLRVSYLVDVLNSQTFASVELDKMNECDVRDSVCILLKSNDYYLSKSRRFGMDSRDSYLLISKSLVLND